MTKETEKSRVALSVRFSRDLAAVLDHIAERGKASRSDVVETVIRAAEPEDRAAIIETTVGPPTEKRNLRLSAEAQERLKQLAGDMAPSEFLRRMIAYAVNSDFPEWRLEFSGDTDPEAQPDSHSPEAADYDPIPPGSALPIGLIVLGALLVLAALGSFVFWLIDRSSERRSRGSDSGPQGQLSDGNTAGDHA